MVLNILAASKKVTICFSGHFVCLFMVTDQKKSNSSSSSSSSSSNKTSNYPALGSLYILYFPFIVFALFIVALQTNSEEGEVTNQFSPFFQIACVYLFQFLGRATLIGLDYSGNQQLMSLHKS